MGVSTGRISYSVGGWNLALDRYVSVNFLGWKPDYSGEDTDTPPPLFLHSYAHTHRSHSEQRSTKPQYISTSIANNAI